MKRTPSEKPDIIIFDVDGVLVDASRSYPEVVSRCLLWAWIRLLDGIPDSPGFTFAHFAATKRSPAFNDDYDIAWAAVNCAASRRSPSLAESLPSPAEWGKIAAGCGASDVRTWVLESFGEWVPMDVIRKACEELYFGQEELMAMGEEILHVRRNRGLWEEDRPLTSLSWKSLPLPSGIYTGRPLRELRQALKLIGWQDFPGEMVVTPESGILKPSPDGIGLLCRRAGRNIPLFLGDAESDRQSLAAFGKGIFAAIGDFLPDASMSFASPDEALSALSIL